ncbi:MAG: hypothetical protein QOJ99_1465 [Bryobacterales bacterium]|nr:hypothetical protein [Bryobacterales bacterium]
MEKTFSAGTGCQEPAAIRLPRKQFGADPLGSKQQIFVERWDGPVVLESPPPVIGLGRRRKDFNNQPRIQKRVTLIVKELRFAGDGAEIGIGNRPVAFTRTRMSLA